MRTRLTPPATINLHGEPDPRAGMLMEFLKPAIVLNTFAGPVPIAPYGMPEGIAPELETWAIYVGLGLAAFAGAFMALGYRLAR